MGYKFIVDHNNECLVCKAKFDEPEKDSACGEDICPKCGVHLPQNTFMYVMEA